MHFNNLWYRHGMAINAVLPGKQHRLYIFKMVALLFMMASSNVNIFRVTGLCAGNPRVTGKFPLQRPVTPSFDFFFHLYLNKRLSKQSWGWWFETPSRPLCRHRNIIYLQWSYLLGWGLNLPMAHRLGLLTIGCSPGGGASNIWTLQLEGDVALSIVMTFCSILCALCEFLVTKSWVNLGKPWFWDKIILKSEADVYAKWVVYDRWMLFHKWLVLKHFSIICQDHFRWMNIYSRGNNFISNILSIFFPFPSYCRTPPSEKSWCHSGWWP